MKINNIIMAIAVSAMTIFTGCKSVPSDSTVYSASYAIGVVSGYACELSKTKTEVRDGIVNVLEVAKAVVPATNETFVAAWTPIIDAEISKLVEAKKISEDEGKLIKTAAITACNGIDFVFTRHPTWKTYENLVSSATNGFVDGFTTIVKNAVLDEASARKIEDDDIRAYIIYLKSTK